MLSKLVSEVGREIGINIEGLNTNMCEDKSDSVHWMFDTSAFGFYIYRASRGSVQSREISIDRYKDLDTELIKQQIRYAIEDLRES